LRLPDCAVICLAPQNNPLALPAGIHPDTIEFVAGCDKQVSVMKKSIVSAILLQLFVMSSACAELEGAYERISLINTRTGESPEAANRKGLLIMAHGHYSMMTMNPDRRVLGADEKLEDLSRDDQVAYLQEWLDINGHTGRYEVDGDTLIWYRDISENPQEVGTVSRLGFEDKGAQLIIFFTLPNGDRYEWVWRRL